MHPNLNYTLRSQMIEIHGHIYYLIAPMNKLKASK